jgi:hypothetical protein
MYFQKIIHPHLSKTQCPVYSGQKSTRHDIEFGQRAVDVRDVIEQTDKTSGKAVTKKVSFYQLLQNFLEREYKIAPGTLSKIPKNAFWVYLRNDKAPAQNCLKDFQQYGLDAIKTQFRQQMNPAYLLLYDEKGVIPDSTLKAGAATIVARLPETPAVNALYEERFYVYPNRFPGKFHVFQFTKDALAV